MLRLALICCLLVAPQVQAQQQTPLPSGPDSVALAFVQALGRHDFSTAAALAHPISLSALQHDLITIAEVAPDAQRVRWMTGMESPQAVAALSPSDAFAHHMDRLLEIMPYLGPALQSYSPRLIGTVIEADTAYVVLRVRATEMGTVLDEAHAIRLVRLDRGWRVLLPARLRWFAANIADDE